MLLIDAVPSPTLTFARVPFTQTPMTSLYCVFTKSGYSSELRTKSRVMVSPVGVNVISRNVASNELPIARALKSASPSMPPVALVEVPPDWFVFVLPSLFVKSIALPVERITPVSPGVVNGETASPFEYVPLESASPL